MDTGNSEVKARGEGRWKPGGEGQREENGGICNTLNYIYIKGLRVHCLRRMPRTL